jgi:hypothetical protein
VVVEILLFKWEVGGVDGNVDVDGCTIENYVKPIHRAFMVMELELELGET